MMNTRLVGRDLRRRYGATGNGSADDTAAIQDAIDEIPENSGAWAASADRRDGAHEIIAPQCPRGGAYVITSTIYWPENKSIVLQSEARYGVRFVWAGPPGEPMFRFGGSGRRSHVLKRLILHRGAVAMEGDGRFWTEISECDFVEVPGKAVYTEGGSIVGGSIWRCHFWDCSEAVAFDHDACDLWQIWQPIVVRCSGVGITLKSSGILVYDGDFEQKAVGSEQYPHIWLAYNGLQQIIKNRFAPETGVGGANPPRECIVIGESLTDPGASTFSRLTIKDNEFQGANAGPSATIANYALRLNNPIERSAIDDNKFREYFGGIVQQNYLGNCRRTSWKRNIVIDGHKKPIFSKGGIEWDRDDFPRQSGERSTTNLLGHSENLAAWIATGCSVVTAGGIHTVTKTAAGTSHLRHQLANSATGATLVFSAKVRNIDAKQFALRIYDSTALAWLSDPNLNITIADEHDGWREVVLRVRPPSGNTLTAYVAIEATGSSLDSGSFEVRDIQLEEGYDPTPYLPTYDANRRTRPHGARMHGGAIISEGTAAPVSGYWRQGDEVVYSNPAASGKRGAVCVTSGTPGTWKEWGAIDA